MSWLGGWFGGNSSAKTSAASKEAIVRLRQQLDMLRKREMHTEKQIAEQDAIARRNVSTNVTAAKAALKRKKVLEKNLETTQAHIATLETQMNAVENANINIETVKAMKQASDAMKKVQTRMGIDDVEATMDEIRENMDQANEISSAITAANLGDPIDEDELANELEAMQQEQLDERMLGAPAAPVTATPGMVKPVAAKKVAPVEDDEEEELRKLQAEMAM